MNTLITSLLFPSLKWFLTNSGGILGISAFLSLGLLAITIFILFHLQDYKKFTAITFIFLSSISLSFSLFMCLTLYKYMLALVI